MSYSTLLIQANKIADELKSKFDLKEAGLQNLPIENDGKHFVYFWVPIYWRKNKKEFK
jgi:hypothetical protein